MSIVHEIVVVKQWIVINGYNGDEMKTSLGEGSE